MKEQLIRQCAVLAIGSGQLEQEQLDEVNAYLQEIESKERLDSAHADAKAYWDDYFGKAIESMDRMPPHSDSQRACGGRITTVLFKKTWRSLTPPFQRGYMFVDVESFNEEMSKIDTEEGEFDRAEIVRALRKACVADGDLLKLRVAELVEDIEQSYNHDDHPAFVDKYGRCKIEGDITAIFSTFAVSRQVYKPNVDPEGNGILRFRDMCGQFQITLVPKSSPNGKGCLTALEFGVPNFSGVCSRKYDDLRMLIKDLEELCATTI